MLFMEKLEFYIFILLLAQVDFQHLQLLQAYLQLLQAYHLRAPVPFLLVQLLVLQLAVLFPPHLQQSAVLLPPLLFLFFLVSLHHQV